MAIFSGASRTVIIRANRETIGLVVAATAMTFALAYSIHSRPPAAPEPVVTAERDWTGQLADVAPKPAQTPAPFKSADLVVPPSQLALPALPAKPKRVCDDTTCTKVPLPPVRKTMTAAIAPPHRVVKEPSLLSALNPLNHVPSLSTIGKPFTYAGDMVGGWLKRF